MLISLSGPEARGFIIGCPVAYSMGIGFAPVQKEGKLPREVIRYEYDLRIWYKCFNNAQRCN